MKTNTFLLSILFFLACTTLHAQKGEAHYKKLYAQAKQYGDVNLATTALHNIIALGNTKYKDTLAAVYTNNGNYGSGYLLTKELLQQHPKDAILLNYQFSNAANVGRIEEAVSCIDTLLAQEPNNIVYHYQKAKLLTSKGPTSNALQAINAGLAIPVIEKQIMVDGVKGNRIAVPIQSELYNLKGLVYYTLKDHPGAKEAFTKALQLAPEHKLVANNLAALDSNEKG